MSLKGGSRQHRQLDSVTTDHETRGHHHTHGLLSGCPLQLTMRPVDTTIHTVYCLAVCYNWPWDPWTPPYTRSTVWLSVTTDHEPRGHNHTHGLLSGCLLQLTMRPVDTTIHTVYCLAVCYNWPWHLWTQPYTRSTDWLSVTTDHDTCGHHHTHGLLSGCLLQLTLRPVDTTIHTVYCLAVCYNWPWDLWTPPYIRSTVWLSVTSDHETCGHHHTHGILSGCLLQLTMRPVDTTIHTVYCLAVCYSWPWDLWTPPYTRSTVWLSVTTGHETCGHHHTHGLLSGCLLQLTMAPVDTTIHTVYCLAVCYKWPWDLWTQPYTRSTVWLSVTTGHETCGHHHTHGLMSGWLLQLTMRPVDTTIHTVYCLAVWNDGKSQPVFRTIYIFPDNGDIYWDLIGS